MPSVVGIGPVAQEYPTLDGVRPGGSGRVARLVGPVAVRRRLAEMGLVPGVQAAVHRIAPLGDPIEVGVRGYRLSLRRDQARCIVLGSEPIVPSGQPSAVSSAPSWNCTPSRRWKV